MASPGEQPAITDRERELLAQIREFQVDAERRQMEVVRLVHALYPDECQQVDADRISDLLRPALATVGYQLDARGEALTDPDGLAWDLTAEAPKASILTPDQRRALGLDGMTPGQVFDVGR